MGSIGSSAFDPIQITNMPITVNGLVYSVAIYDKHMQIDCELHTFQDWDTFDDERIRKMDPGNALPFWQKYKKLLLGIARSAGRYSS